jgi:hypothetical protein
VRRKQARSIHYHRKIRGNLKKLLYKFLPSSTAVGTEYPITIQVAISTGMNAQIKKTIGRLINIL